MENENKKFNQYLYLAKNVLILRLDGTLSRLDRGDLDELQSKVLKLEFSHLILNLSKVTQIDPLNFRFLVQVQNIVRKQKGGNVRVIPPSKQIKEKLTDQGILRSKETCLDLKSALESI